MSRTGSEPEKEPGMEVESASDLKDAERQGVSTAKNAVKLKLAGASYPEIADVLGYKSAASARIAVETALGNMFFLESDYKAMRQVNALRYEELLRSLAPKALRSKNEDGSANEQHLAYAREFRSTLDSIARLHGLNAPTINMQVTPESEEWEKVVSMVVDTHRQLNDSPEGDVFSEDEPLELEEGAGE